MGVELGFPLYEYTSLGVMLDKLYFSIPGFILLLLSSLIIFILFVLEIIFEVFFVYYIVFAKMLINFLNNTSVYVMYFVLLNFTNEVTSLESFRVG